MFQSGDIVQFQASGNSYANQPQVAIVTAVNVIPNQPPTYSIAVLPAVASYIVGMHDVSEGPGANQILPRGAQSDAMKAQAEAAKQAEKVMQFRLKEAAQGR